MRHVFCNDCLKFDHDNSGCWNNKSCVEGEDNREGGRPKRKRRMTRKQARTIKQEWLVKKPVEYTGNAAVSHGDEILKSGSNNLTECTILASNNLNFVSHASLFPCHGKEGEIT